MKIFRFNFSFGPYFCLKIGTKIMLITLTKQIIHIKSLNFNEKIIDLFQEIERNWSLKSKLHQFLKNRDGSNWD